MTLKEKRKSPLVPQWKKEWTESLRLAMKGLGKAQKIVR